MDHDKYKKKVIRMVKSCQTDKTCKHTPLAMLYNINTREGGGILTLYNSKPSSLLLVAFNYFPLRRDHKLRIHSILSFYSSITNLFACLFPAACVIGFRHCTPSANHRLYLPQPTTNKYSTTKHKEYILRIISCLTSLKK